MTSCRSRTAHYDRAKPVSLGGTAHVSLSTQITVSAPALALILHRGSRRFEAFQVAQSTERQHASAREQCDDGTMGRCACDRIHRFAWRNRCEPRSCAAARSIPDRHAAACHFRVPLCQLCDRERASEKGRNRRQDYRLYRRTDGNPGSGGRQSRRCMRWIHQLSQRDRAWFAGKDGVQRQRRQHLRHCHARNDYQARRSPRKEMGHHANGRDLANLCRSVAQQKRVARGHGGLDPHRRHRRARARRHRQSSRCGAVDGW